MTSAIRKATVVEHSPLFFNLIIISLPRKRNYVSLFYPFPVGMMVFLSNVFINFFKLQP